MPSLIRAAIDLFSGEARLRFPYDPHAISVLKEIPGSAWSKVERCWTVPLNSLPVLERRGLKFLRETSTGARIYAPPPPAELANRLRPYQLEGVEFLLRRRGAILAMDPRTGKTPTSITAACSLLGAGHADALLVIYPNAVRGEWETQLKQWANLELVPLEGLAGLPLDDLGRLHKTPYLALGCHYEILDKRAEDLVAILTGRRYVLVADELHYCKNRKIERTKRLWDLAHADGCVARWGLTGTPMRNRPRDLWAIGEFCGPGQLGKYWSYAKRYCDARENDLGHWEDKGESNLDELAERFAQIAYRKTRAEVAPWLPKLDRRVILCDVPAAQLKAYRALEQQFASDVRRALEDGGGALKDEAMLRRLVAETSAAKIPTAVKRTYEHADRGVKVLVFCHFHETLQTLDATFDAAREAAKERGEQLPPHFCAGGWMDRTKRQAAIEQWRSCSGPSILLANSLSSGLGIDLSDADTAIFLELEWVPSDLKQAEDRIQDVHKGKRTTPPLYEYLLVRNTVDEAMARAVLNKLRAIDAVVGMDDETRGLGTSLRGANLVSDIRLGLPNTNADTVKAALESMRARLMGLGADNSELDDDAAAQAIATDLGEVWEGDQDDNEERAT